MQDEIHFYTRRFHEKLTDYLGEFIVIYKINRKYIKTKRRISNRKIEENRIFG